MEAKDKVWLLVLAGYTGFLILMMLSVSGILGPTLSIVIAVLAVFFFVAVYVIAVFDPTLSGQPVKSIPEDTELKVYLAGPINGCDDSTCKDWREYAKKNLRTETIDPMNRDYRGREMEPGITGEIVEGDKADIDESDILLVNASVPSVGTSMEILYAWESEKTVVSVYTSDKPPSPWLVYHSSVLFKSLDEAVQYINQIIDEWS